MALRTLSPGARRAHRIAGLAVGLALVVGLAPAAGAAAPRTWDQGSRSSAASTKAVPKGRVDVTRAARDAAAKPRKDAAIRKPDLKAPATGAGKATRTTGRPLANDRSPNIVLPSLLQTRKWDGLSKADTPGLEPPDPWVAVNATHVVQSTNSQIRIYNRSGATLVTVPTWAFFATAPDETDFDPKIIWDAYHGRWVAAVASTNGDFSLNFITLAVSETSDPTGAWNLYAFNYGVYLADYPGLASSSDRIVVTVNEFDSTNAFSYDGSSIRTIAWSQLLVGGPVNSDYLFTNLVWNFRPAQVLSTTPYVHLIYQYVGSPNVYQIRQIGTATVPDYGGETDLTATWSVPAEATPPNPRQPGTPATITNPVDGRVVDAVYQNGVLWFVRTGARDLGAGVVSTVEISTLTIASASPTGAGSWYTGGSGSDAFSPGIGMSGAGTLFLIHSLSSPTSYISNVAYVYASGTWSSGITIDNPGYTYTGTRWGDYVGVAIDPAGSAAVWQANEFPAADGTWETSVSRLVFDGVAPTATAPVQTLLAGTTVGQFTVPVRVTWSGTDAGSGITRWWHSQDQFHAGFQPLSAGTSTAITRNHWWEAYGDAADTAYRYQVQAEDDAGNLSTMPAGPYLTPTVYNQTMSNFAYSAGWSNTSSSSFLQGSAKYSTTAGRYVTFTASGRAMGFVSYKGSNRGKVRVYVDGVYKGLITLTSSTSKARQIVFATSWATSGTHKIKLVVYSGRVDIDGFVVLR